MRNTRLGRAHLRCAKKKKSPGTEPGFREPQAIRMAI